MPNKTIYVREGDRELWERAEKMAGGSLSGLLAEALRRYIAERESTGNDDADEIIVEIESRGRMLKKRFYGRWLVDPSEEIRTGEPGHDAAMAWGVAVSRMGKIVVYTYHVNDGSKRWLDYYDSLDEAEKDVLPADIAGMAADELGIDHIQDLRI